MPSQDPSSRDAGGHVSVRLRVWESLEGPSEGRSGRLIAVSIMALVVLNVVALVLESVASIRNVAQPYFDAFEVFSVGVFSLEYAARLWSATACPKFERPVYGRLRLAFTPLVVADLIAILPFYLPFLGVDLRFFRSVRLLRLVRLLKLGRYSRSLRLMGRVVKRTKGELVITVWIVALLLLFASCTMYLVENAAQPEQFSSIPATMWWAATTLTTVGYGDTFPITALGRLTASVIAFLGIGLFALPTSILGAGFIEELKAARSAREAKKCPHCGGVVGDTRP